ASSRRSPPGSISRTLNFPKRAPLPRRARLEAVRIPSGPPLSFCASLARQCRMAGNDHSHHHDAPADFGRAFAVGILLNVAFVIVEVIFGFLANSMSLLADAGHNLSDVIGLVLALAAAMMARRAASPRFTYGFKKGPILAALANSLLLFVAVGAIGAEAVRRLFHPAITHGETVTIVAGAGILINGATALLFARGRKHDLNVRGAY